jgi:hypothetical protein
MLVNPNTLVTEAERKEVQAAAQAIGQQLVIVDVSSDRDIDAAFATFVQRQAGAVLVGTGSFFNSHRERTVAQATRHALPTSHSEREGVMAGGDAGGRLPQQRITWSRRGSAAWLSSGPERKWLHRRAQRQYRISLGRGAK